MYDLELTKKKKRRKRVAIITSICSIGVAALCIVAFIGRKVGTFTISLRNEDVSLTMDTKHEFPNPTSYLHVVDVPPISGPHSYGWFETSPDRGWDQIHNEDYGPELGKDSNVDGLRFFKYTFFLKNNGSINAAYDMKINLIDKHDPTNGSEPLIEYLRIMVFEDEVRQVYARRTKTDESPENPDRKEDIYGPGTGKAELFEENNNNRLVTWKNKLETGKYKKYTILFWLEGEDPECKVVPDTAWIKMGVTINARPA